jgi:hypothetical protein
VLRYAALLLPYKGHFVAKLEGNLLHIHKLKRRNQHLRSDISGNTNE